MRSGGSPGLKSVSASVEWFLLNVIEASAV